MWIGAQIGRQQILQSAFGLLIGDGAGDERWRHQGQQDEVLRDEDRDKVPTNLRGVIERFGTDEDRRQFEQGDV